MSASEPAPEDLLLAFLNTIDVEDVTDEMSDLGTWRAWVAGRVEYADLPAPTASTLRQARDLRAYLRTVALGATPTTPPPQLSVGVDLAAGGRLTGASVPARVVAAVATLASENRWERVKICPADDCRWAFYDRSRNQSRHWCSMAVCGNRAKVRHHRAQAGHAQESAPSR